MKWKKYIKPYLPYFIAGPLCMILEVIGEVLMPWFLKSVLNEGTGGTLTVGKSVLYACLLYTSQPIPSLNRRRPEFRLLHFRLR